MKFPMLILIAVILLGGCVRHLGVPASSLPANTPKTGFTVQRAMAYTPAGWPETLLADLYLPSTPGPHPALVTVHGGGWSSRSREDMDGVAESFAARGYAVFNVSYRFAPEHQFPAQVLDIQQAVRWLRAHADEYAIDAARVAGYGYSSGGHLLAMLATLSPGDELYGGGETRLQAVILGGAPTDLREFTGGSLVPDFLGTTHDEGYPTFVAASPITYVDAGDAPAFNYHGGSDLLVDSKYAEAMHAALVAAGVRSELYIESIKGHVTMFLARGGADRAALRFLDRVLGESVAGADAQDLAVDGVGQ